MVTFSSETPPTPPTLSEAAAQLRAPPATGPRAAAALFGVSVLVALLHPVCTRDAAVADSTLDAVATRIHAANPRAFVLVHPPWRQDVLAGVAARLKGRDVGLALPPDAMEGRRPVIALLCPVAPAPGALSRWRAEVTEELDGLGVKFFHAAHLQPEEPVKSPSPREDSVVTDQGTGRLDLRARLDTAVVAVQSAGRTVACNAWDGAQQRWTCPGMNDWNFVGPRVLPVGGQARSCLWAHPVTDATLTITFPGVPLRRALRLGHGLSDGAAGLEGAADVRVQLSAGAASRQVVHPNAPGWLEDVVDTAAGTADVILAITTAHDGARHFCFSLTVEP